MTTFFSGESSGGRRVDDLSSMNWHENFMPILGVWSFFLAVVLSIKSHKPVMINLKSALWSVCRPFRVLISDTNPIQLRATNPIRFQIISENRGAIMFAPKMPKWMFFYMPFKGNFYVPTFLSIGSKNDNLSVLDHYQICKKIFRLFVVTFLGICF